MGKILYSKSDFETILPTYKFYLAIENSRCTDYVTEKFWHHCIKSEVVCIVAILFRPPPGGDLSSDSVE